MDETHGLDDQLCFALYAASRSVTSAYREGLASLGLTYPQFIALVALWENDGVGVKELGTRLQLDSGTLSPLLKRLEALGLLSRERAAQDERRVIIHLTAAGTALQGPAARVQQQVAEQFALAPDEARLLHSLARRITQHDQPLT